MDAMNNKMNKAIKAARVRENRLSFVNTQFRIAKKEGNEKCLLLVSDISDLGSLSSKELDKLGMAMYHVSIGYGSCV